MIFVVASGQSAGSGARSRTSSRETTHRALILAPPCSASSRAACSAAALSGWRGSRHRSAGARPGGPCALWGIRRGHTGRRQASQRRRRPAAQRERRGGMRPHAGRRAGALVVPAREDLEIARQVRGALPRCCPSSNSKASSRSASTSASTQWLARTLQALPSARLSFPWRSGHLAREPRRYRDSSTGEETTATPPLMAERKKRDDKARPALVASFERQSRTHVAHVLLECFVVRTSALD